MSARLVLALIVLSLAGVQAMAQSSLKPETEPRLPPQTGQGLPLKDRQFIAQAADLSNAQIQAGQLAAEKASGGPVKAFAEKLKADHEQLRKSLADLAQKNQASIQPPASPPAWQADLQRLRSLSGPAFDHEFLAWQLQMHVKLADLYQTQASSTPATDLAQFSIISLNRIQERFDEAKKLGASEGLTVDTVKQPPQY